MLKMEKDPFTNTSQEQEHGRRELPDDFDYKNPQDNPYSNPSKKERTLISDLGYKASKTPGTIKETATRKGLRLEKAVERFYSLIKRQGEIFREYVFNNDREKLHVNIISLNKELLAIDDSLPEKEREYTDAMYDTLYDIEKRLDHESEN